MRLIHKVCVVCSQGGTCYWKGSVMEAGIVTSIEDQSWEGVDGIMHTCIYLMNGDIVLGKLIDVPVEVEYESSALGKLK